MDFADRFINAVEDNNVQDIILDMEPNGDSIKYHINGHYIRARELPFGLVQEEFILPDGSTSFTKDDIDLSKPWINLLDMALRVRHSPLNKAII